MARETQREESARALVVASPRVPAFVGSFAAFARRKPLGAVGAGILIAIVLIAILAPFISPNDPYEPSAPDIYGPPGGTYLLGGDEAGRDVLSRLFHGARISMYVGLVSVGVGVTVGSFLGIVSANAGGKFDLIVQRGVDAPWPSPS